MKDILIIYKDDQINRILKNSLEKDGYPVTVASCAEEGLTYAQERPCLIVTDTALPDMEGLTLLRRLKKITPESICVAILSPSLTKNEALNAGAHEYLEKPFTIFALNLIIEETLRTVKQKTEKSRKSYRQKTAPLSPFLMGKNSLIVEVQNRIKLLIYNKANILISGEKGTGKEEIAQVIHKGRFDNKGSFISLNLETLPWPLQESQILGTPKGGSIHEEGALSKAQGGTLFLGSVENLTQEIQEMLVNILQDEENGTDIHLISSTTTDIDNLVEKGMFCKELLELISTERLFIPPLRQRREDSVMIAKYFIKEIKEKTRAGSSHMSSDVEHYLLSHDWSHNIKELEREIKRACLISKDDCLTLDDIVTQQPDSIGEFLEQKLSSYMHKIKKIENFNLYETVITEVERALIHIALKETRGNQLRAAKFLNINRNTLKKKIDQLHIEVNEFKAAPNNH
jgi:DNA-binding NtrC family response regulator